jgi:hypothetical protein
MNKSERYLLGSILDTMINDCNSSREVIYAGESILTAFPKLQPIVDEYKVVTLINNARDVLIERLAKSSTSMSLRTTRDKLIFKLRVDFSDDLYTMTSDYISDEELDPQDFFDEMDQEGQQATAYMKGVINSLEWQELCDDTFEVGSNIHNFSTGKWIGHGEDEYETMRD